MANANGNNLEDLFRQASDQYPLRTDSSDWDKLASALDADPSLISPQAGEQADKRRRKRFLWLLLPLIGGSFGYYAWQGSHAPQKEMAKIKPLLSPAEHTHDVTDPHDRINAKVVPADKRPGAEEDLNMKGDANKAQVSANKTQLGAKTGINRTTGAGSEAAWGKNAAYVKTGAHVGDRENGMTAEAGVNRRTEVNEGPGINKGTRINEGTGTNEEAGVNTTGIGRIDKNKAGEATRGRMVTGVPDDAPYPGEALYSRVIAPGPMTKGDVTISADVRSRWEKASAQSSQGLSQPAPMKKNKTAQHKHSIYVGILGAPDLSTIDFQPVKSVGTTFGILAGYTLNSKWSLETGVYVDKKKYYTDGSYFSTKNVLALQSRYVNLQDVNGSCNMVEIPLNLRYDLFGGPQRKWFATAGLSTYLMSKEQYDYKILWNGAPQSTQPFTYTNPYHYLFSIVNMSFGYEQKLGKIGNLRIEPYLRIPLSGIGTGSLSILSAGLNLGITRRIW